MTKMGTCCFVPFSQPVTPRPAQLNRESALAQEWVATKVSDSRVFPVLA
jgi:hypothetical protein